MSSVEATKDADKGTWRKKFVTRLEKIVNDEQRNERTYHVRGNSEYDKSNDSAVSDTEESDIEESDMEVIDAGQNSKEIDDLSQDETGIRNKLLKILVARQEKDTKSGKNFMTSIHLNGILDFSMM
ncbi:uncharacterized protein OCT59_003869 [Rhizophagus irregularis]|uniref:uncharacterized protein n=1 Tax=Rhizophagus irregularis TaxID=588596 RepID=UPI00332DD75D|nr:hypothetical protein OCT59_003869 [Rhizophagus irregularis]